MPWLFYFNRAISIHALLAESDAAFFVCHHDSQYFYPRSPCGERPGSSRNAARWRAISIHALLAESDETTVAALKAQIISIHALLAESDMTVLEWLQELEISIHALLAESDLDQANQKVQELKFLSTLSLRRATVDPEQIAKPFLISIHALLAESDTRPRARICHF